MKYVLFSLDVLSYCLSNSYWFYSVNMHHLLFLILGFFFTLQELDSVFWSSLFDFLTTWKSTSILIFIFLWISTFLFNLFLSLSFVLSFVIIPQDSCVQRSLVSWSLNLFCLLIGVILIKKLLHEILELNFFILQKRGMFFLCTDLFYSVLHCQ